MFSKYLQTYYGILCFSSVKNLHKAPLSGIKWSTMTQTTFSQYLNPDEVMCLAQYLIVWETTVLR